MAKAKAKTKAKATRSQVQIPEGGYFIRCVEINTYEDKKGREKEIYTTILNDNEQQTVTLFERDNFKLKLNDCCVPVISIVPIGYLDKQNQPKSRNTYVVDWVFDPERSADNDDDLDDTEQQQ